MNKMYLRILLKYLVRILSLNKILVKKKKLKEKSYGEINKLKEIYLFKLEYLIIKYRFGL